METTIEKPVWKIGLYQETKQEIKNSNIGFSSEISDTLNLSNLRNNSLLSQQTFNNISRFANGTQIEDFPQFLLRFGYLNENIDNMENKVFLQKNKPKSLDSMSELNDRYLIGIKTSINFSTEAYISKINNFNSVYIGDHVDENLQFNNVYYNKNIFEDLIKEIAKIHAYLKIGNLIYHVDNKRSKEIVINEDDNINIDKKYKNFLPDNENGDIHIYSEFHYEQINEKILYIYEILKLDYNLFLIHNENDKSNYKRIENMRLLINMIYFVLTN